ncbi:Hypothetical Protein FCC1311_113342 [Hondaea fermentalgiana]|uniref:AP2/ERF domain-containing protein n=1 Tax=Hondaea fermentalgiana TaxID=2315210 RepID=A0A2R5H2P2_9STRA|nr:Hypothetical Protein FCC1311_113342 [Hondaea fermentalgiana]|eukprot:GBG35111.1 Hypothetical Protein FCC1311_113342 [Hondaea fermentalgiana]
MEFAAAPWPSYEERWSHAPVAANSYLVSAAPESIPAQHLHQPQHQQHQSHQPVLTVTDEDLSIDLDYDNLFEDPASRFQCKQEPETEFAQTSLMSYGEPVHHQINEPSPIVHHQEAHHHQQQQHEINALPTDYHQFHEYPAAPVPMQSQEPYIVPRSPREVCAQPVSFKMSPEMSTRQTATASKTSKNAVRKNCMRPRTKRGKGTSSKITVLAPNGCELSTRNQKLTSPFKGVCWYKRTKKWVVQVKIRGYRQHVGYFDDEVKAAEAYKAALAKIQHQNLI